MKQPKLLAFLCALTWPLWLPSAQGDAVIEGTVTLPTRKADAPANPRYQVKNPAAVAAPDPPVAVVYLEGQFPAAIRTNLPTQHLKQKGYQFAPGLLPVQKGTTVEFPNFDDEYHSVFSYSKSKRFDLGRYRKDEKPATQTFEQPGVVKLYCEIHEHMRGLILVLDTPHFTNTYPTGKYRLERLPAGQYQLKAWIDEKTVWQKPVELKDGETLRMDFDGK